MASGRRGVARRAAALSIAVVLAMVAACGGGESDEESSSSTAAATTEKPTTTVAPEEAAKAAYLEFVDAVDRLLKTEPNPEDGELAELAIDPVLGRVRDSLSDLQTENQIWRTGPRSAHRVISSQLSESDTVVLRDCYVGNDTRIDLDDGSIVSSGLSTELLEVTLSRVDGRWVVSAVTTEQVFEGEVECSG